MNREPIWRLSFEELVSALVLAAIFAWTLF